MNIKSKTHELKTCPKYFNQTLNGRKPFEIRFNDRNFKVGDFVILKEWNKTNFTGRQIYGIIEYILRDDFEGLSKGYIAFTLAISKKIYN